MQFETMGDPHSPAVLFFHAMGVTGASSEPVAKALQQHYYCILSPELQERCYFAFGSGEDHFKYRPAVMQAYPQGHFPVFDGYDHMQYQIRDPQGFAALLEAVMQDTLPQLPFLQA